MNQDAKESLIHLANEWYDSCYDTGDRGCIWDYIYKTHATPTPTGGEEYIKRLEAEKKAYIKRLKGIVEKIGPVEALTYKDLFSSEEEKEKEKMLHWWSVIQANELIVVDPKEDGNEWWTTLQGIFSPNQGGAAKKTRRRSRTCNRKKKPKGKSKRKKTKKKVDRTKKKKN